MKTQSYMLIVMLFTCMVSCGKKEYDESFTTFAPVYFANRSVLNFDLQVRYEGTPLLWNEAKIVLPEGEGKFEFYDRRNGNVLGEKTVKIDKNNPESYVVFQPLESSALAFLDGNGQDGMPAAPEGFIKLKVANYATGLLPFDKTDIIVVGINSNFEFIPLDTLEAVSQNLGDEDYHLVPTNSDILGYSFYFRQHGTETLIKNSLGENYINMDVALVPGFMSPIPVKNIFTIYFLATQQNVEADHYIRSGDKYYQIQPEVLYAD